MSNKKHENVNKERLRKLKQIGVMENESLRESKFDKNKNARIRNAWKKYQEIANLPTEYKKENVSKLADWQINQLKKSGITVINDKAFIPKNSASSITIKTQKVKKDDGFFESRVLIERKYQDTKNGIKREKREVEFLAQQKEIPNLNERLIRDYNGIKDKAKKTGENAVISVKVFDRGAWTKVRTDSITILMNYISDVAWHAPKSEVPMLKDNINLVVTYFKNPTDIDTGIRSQKERSKVNYQRKKSAKITKTKSLLSGEVKRK